MRDRGLVYAGVGIAAMIVLASVVFRPGPAADPVADVGTQREAVGRFHSLVRDGRWAEVYRSVTEPPVPDATTFAALMQEQQAEHGRIVRIDVSGMRLRRSRTVPLLEVHETVTLSKDDETRVEDVVSFFAWHEGTWLFAFSSPREEPRT